MKSTVLWDIRQCRPLKVNVRFRGTYCLYFRGRRIIREIFQRESRWQAELYAGILLGLLFDPEDGDDVFLRNVG
jgi:hypothetical protein